MGCSRLPPATPWTSARVTAKCPGRGESDVRGRPKLYADIAHPIHQGARDFVQGAILSAYRSEVVRSQEVGYVAQSFEDLDYQAYEEEWPEKELEE